MLLVLDHKFSQNEFVAGFRLQLFDIVYQPLDIKRGCYVSLGRSGQSGGRKRGVGGKKKEVQFYESFTCKEFEPEPYIGKLIKIWEHLD